MYRALKAVFYLLLACFFAFGSSAQIGIPPKITAQPSDQVVLTGDIAVFQVMATSDTLMTYKWYHNGVPILGGIFSSYTILLAQVYDAGTYYVEVSNLSGTTKSDTAT